MPKRIAKRIKKPKNVWLRELSLSDPELGLGLDYTAEGLRLRAPSGGLCAVCKGSKLLCGKTRCPVIARLTSYLRIWRSAEGLSVDGSSPPSVFVGRFGYPYVNVGPMTPPYRGDTSMLDAPERWMGKTIEEIIDFRSQLIRGMHRVHVKRLDEAGRILDRTRELALADHYVETEMRLKKRPVKRFYLDGDVQPIGPTAPLEGIDVGYVKWDRHMEKAHYDTDLKASEAARMLFDSGMPVTRIQRAFSLGSFGIGRNRRLVPTRWSITAVDDIVSKDLANRVKEYPQVNRFEVYESNYLGNRFIVLLVPDAWSYEAYEAWYPRTLWNPSGDHVSMVTDWEGYNGRWRYAAMGGCYYAGRLAVLEHLSRVKRQARVFILREA
ncbi:MAG: hypothetical protein ACE5OO_04680, partial [Candidatus Bathyarchaeia archaeon]